jgi:hypothetical protein
MSTVPTDFARKVILLGAKIGGKLPIKVIALPKFFAGPVFFTHYVNRR